MQITRNIDRLVERELWARSAGRCQFNGCNRALYKSPVTEEQANISEKAHIYSFSVDGPRGHGPYATNIALLNTVENLLLVCHDCHVTIDQDKNGERYSGDLLRKWKNDHEKRVAIVTGIDPTKKSHVILYAANISDQTSPLQPKLAQSALFPDWYPAEERPIHVSMSWEGKDDQDYYWKTEEQNLRRAFERQIRPLLSGSDTPHLSIFTFAPMPLMTLFGSLLTDKVPAQTYQLHREPAQIWKWLNGPTDTAFHILRPLSFDGPPALIISLSDSIARSRVTSILGETVSIWELTIEQPHNDFLKTKEQLSQFREVARKLMVDIGIAHGKTVPLSFFPAMPIACAVELGRIRMPKADSPWIFYDYNNKHSKFIRALEII